MKKPLLLSLATIAILGTTNACAESMYDRFQVMELEMKKMKKELDALRAKENVATAQETDKDEADDDEEKASAEDDDESDDEEMTVEEQLAEIQDSISDLNKNTNGNHLKFGVDYRFAVENLQYKMADGSKQKNDAFMTNRLWLNMNWAATKNLSFTGQLAYNKAFGARSGANTNNMYETFDWIANENAYDDTLRVRSAYFFYKNDTFMGTDVPWTFSIGRRPSTNGHLVNLRDDDHAASPMGHNINVEFDGLSSKFVLENVTGVEGMYVKFCAGRGMSNAAPRFNTAPYADTTDNASIDLVGLIFTPWSDGQYSVNSQYYYAGNLIDVLNPNNQAAGFQTVGNLHAFTANFVANGIGDGINDYLDDTIFFISGAMSITDPDNGKSMLGSADSEKGYSYWVGVQAPSLISEEGKWGIEFNHGSKYWRSITYGEDTNIGSKLAARGDAYEAYFTEPLIDDILSLQIRYTYIDYKYAGSNGFFGSTSGNAMSIDEAIAAGLGDRVVETAQDIRFYLRYRY